MSTAATSPRPSSVPPLPNGYDELLSANVALITGKGGVGKTTVSAALALAGVASGRRTLVVDVEGRDALSRIFDTAPWDYEEREFRPGLWGAALDPAEAVYEYLELFYGIKRVQWMMERSNALDFVTTAAPGLRDLLLIGKIYEIEQRRGPDGRRAYDLIVVDAPPTGRIVPFLQAPEGVTEIVRVGPIKRQAGQIADMLDNPRRTQAIIVSLLEEMPVQETIESVAALEEGGIRLGPVVANQVVKPHLDDEATTALSSLEPETIAARAHQADLRLSSELAELGRTLAVDHHDRVALQSELRRRLQHEAGRAVLDLPQLTGATFDTAAIEVLADAIALQVGEDGPRARGLLPHPEEAR